MSEEMEMLVDHTTRLAHHNGLQTPEELVSRYNLIADNPPLIPCRGFHSTDAALPLLPEDLISTRVQELN